MGMNIFTLVSIPGFNISDIKKVLKIIPSIRATKRASKEG